MPFFFVLIRIYSIVLVAVSANTVSMETFGQKWIEL